MSHYDRLSDAFQLLRDCTGLRPSAWSAPITDGVRLEYDPPEGGEITFFDPGSFWIRSDQGWSIGPIRCGELLEEDQKDYRRRLHRQIRYRLGKVSLPSLHAMVARCRDEHARYRQEMEQRAREMLPELVERVRPVIQTAADLSLDPNPNRLLALLDQDELLYPTHRLARLLYAVLHVRTRMLGTPTLFRWDRWFVWIHQHWRDVSFGMVVPHFVELDWYQYEEYTDRIWSWRCLQLMVNDRWIDEWLCEFRSSVLDTYEIAWAFGYNPDRLGGFIRAVLDRPPDMVRVTVGNHGDEIMVWFR